MQGALPCPPVLAANLGSERALWLALPAARIETWAPEPEQKPTGRFPPRRAREKKGCEKRSRTEESEVAVLLIGRDLRLPDSRLTVKHLVSNPIEHQFTVAQPT